MDLGFKIYRDFLVDRAPPGVMAHPKMSLRAGVVDEDVKPGMSLNCPLRKRGALLLIFKITDPNRNARELALCFA